MSEICNYPDCNCPIDKTTVCARGLPEQRSSCGKFNDDEHVCPTLKEESEYKTKYYQLIMEVGNKYPNETRHETALRYIKESESNTSLSACSENQEPPESE